MRPAIARCCRISEPDRGDAALSARPSRFEPFGADYAGAEAAGLHLRLPGQWDEATWTEASLGAEVFYNVARWIGPGVGRYAEVDPLGLRGGLNSFAYAASNLLAFIDLLGLALQDYRWASTGDGRSHERPGSRTWLPGELGCDCSPCYTLPSIEAERLPWIMVPEPHSAPIISLPTARLDPDPGLDLPRALRLLRRVLPWTAFGAAGGLALALVAVLAFDGPIYRASSVLLVGDPEGAGMNGGRVPILPMDGYIRLLMSRAVLRAANQAVSAQELGLSEGGIDSRLISARPVEVRRGEFGTTAMIELTAMHRSNEVAAAFVNAWARALVAVEGASSLRTAFQRVLFDLGGERLKLRDRQVWLEARRAAAERDLPTLERTIPIVSRVTDPVLLAGRDGAGAGDTVVTQESNALYVDLASKLNEYRLELAQVRREQEVVDADEAAVVRALRQLEEIKQIRVPPADGESTLRAGSLGAVVGSIEPGDNPLLGRVLALRGAVSVMREADIPARPLPGRRSLQALLGTLGGAILGALAAFLREGLRRLT